MGQADDQLNTTVIGPEVLANLGLDPSQVGVVIVDHGSRREESNRLLEAVAESFRRLTQLPIVEPAHMELAQPSIATAFSRAVQQGAQLVIGSPYFLAPGRHWRQDIPRLFRQAAEANPGTRYLVTAPLGLHPLMLNIIQDRVRHCLQHALFDDRRCDVCIDEEAGCQLDKAHRAEQ